MLRRLAHRGGFWQSVTGAPLPGETDRKAAAREVREETGFDVRATVRALGVTYSYALSPKLAQRWEDIYGPGIAAITVVAFAAEVLRGPIPCSTLASTMHSCGATTRLRWRCLTGRSKRMRCTDDARRCERLSRRSGTAEATSRPYAFTARMEAPRDPRRGRRSIGAAGGAAKVFRPPELLSRKRCPRDSTSSPLPIARRRRSRDRRSDPLALRTDRHRLQRQPGFA
jgi:NUDIX domain